MVYEKSLRKVLKEELGEIGQHYKQIEELIPNGYRLAVDVWNDTV